MLSDNTIVPSFSQDTVIGVVPPVTLPCQAHSVLPGGISVGPLMERPVGVVGAEVITSTYPPRSFSIEIMGL